MILLHGFTGAKENWLPVMGHLSTRFRVLAPDLPGWGESGRSADEDHSFSGQAARLEQFVQAVSGGQSVFLVGHSMGGGIAAMSAGQRPSWLRRLVLMDAAGLPFENAFSDLVREGKHPFEVTDQAQFERQLNMVFKQPPWVPWPADRAFIERRRASAAFEREVLAAVAGDEARAFAPGDAAANIAVPTLLLWCKDDQIIDASVATAYAARIPDAALVLLDDCNHMPMMEQPAEIAQLMLEFFSSAPPQ
nr:alpha/beta fold hydrolase [Pseudomarimonas arenosa]